MDRSDMIMTRRRRRTVADDADSIPAGGGVVVGARFKRVAAAFDEAAARVRPCQSSSGSSHHLSPQHHHLNSADHDLSDLVDSFMEAEYHQLDEEADPDPNNSQDDDDSDHKNAMNTLQNLLNANSYNHGVLQKILAETQRACAAAGDTKTTPPHHGFKRRLMSDLRDAGFDAGLCKSRWEKFGGHPAGEYEYVDVNVDGERYIVEVCLAAEFEIARPTPAYAALLHVIPPAFVGRPEELKHVVRFMCSAIRESIKGKSMHVPPWRRNGYMQAKWFSPYKRTTNQVPPAATSAGSSPYKDSQPSCSSKRSINGFEIVTVVARLSTLPMFRCRDDFVITRTGLPKPGYLTAAFNT